MRCVFYESVVELYLQGPSHHRELSPGGVCDETVVIYEQQQQHVPHMSAGNAIECLSDWTSVDIYDMEVDKIGLVVDMEVYL